MRGLGQAIGDWQKLFRQAYDNISPGGVLQIVDVEIAAYSDDGSIPQDCALWIYQERINEGLEKLGRRDPNRLLEGFLKAAGWEQVKIVKKKVPWVRAELPSRLTSLKLIKIVIGALVFSLGFPPPCSGH